MENKDSLGAALGVRCVEWTDRVGTRHSLPPLSTLDLAETEIAFGPISTWAEEEKIGSDIWAATIWRSLRKENLSRTEIREKKWRMGVELAAELVPIGKESFVEKDAFGVDQTFHPLTLLDLTVIEAAFGKFKVWGVRRAHPIALLQRIMWLSLRKQGKTPEQVAAGQYALDEEDAGLLFHPSLAGSERFSKLLDAGLIAAVGDLWINLLSGGGIKIGVAENPPVAPPEEGAG